MHPRATHASLRRARWRCSSRLVLNDLFELVGNLSQGFERARDLPIAASCDDVHTRECRISGRVVVSGMAAAALLSFDGSQRDRLRYHEHEFKIECLMPGRVVLAVSRDG